MSCIHKTNFTNLTCTVINDMVNTWFRYYLILKYNSGKTNYFALFFSFYREPMERQRKRFVFSHLLEVFFSSFSQVSV